MAAVTHAVDLASTANIEVYTTGAFTPAAGDLLVASISISGSVVTPTVTTSDGLTFTVVHDPGTTEYFAIANEFANAVSQTLAVDVTGDPGNGIHVSVERVSGMTRRGLGASRQTAFASGLAGNTPEATFAKAALPENPTIVMVRNLSNPAGVTPPTGWTEQADIGHDTPTAGQEVASRDSGFAGTTVTWGSTSATGWGANLLELNTAVDDVLFAQSVM